ncbi:MAG: carboxylesterase family protein [Lachnospiraceae bacterium]|nr:carboxylesterase family protein [Lachnospiraceae bacterium]
MYNKSIQDFLCSESDPVVQTGAGKVRGYRINGIYTFCGIPYARAERFRLPEPVEPWEGIMDTQDYGHVCPTRPEHTTVGNLAFPKRYWLADENCQYLNIWTKQLDADAKRPVVVWLHGGGFAAGSCLELECYDGENMCRYGDVVQVSLNHRLNIYGFLDLSDYGPEYEASGIAGMEDIVSALKWIRDNITAFGGDPENVTILGESGGGGKVRTLMQMASADGLYHRAIVDSGILPCQDTTPEEEKENARAFAGRIVEAAGGLECLLQMDNYHLQNLIDRTAGTDFFNWCPVPRTGSYTGEWYNAGFRKETLHIPLIAGSVFTELVPRPSQINDKNALTQEQRYQAIVDAYGEEPAPAISEAFRKAYPEFNVYFASLADCMVRRPTVDFCVKRTMAGGKDTYNFLFAHETGYKGGLLSTHADELAFVFHNAEYIGALFAGEQTWKIQDEIFYSFMAFARTGDPNNEKITPWKRVTPQERNCFVFSKTPGNRVSHDEELMELIGKYSRHAQPRWVKKQTEKESTK